LFELKSNARPLRVDFGVAVAPLFGVAGAPPLFGVGGAPLFGVAGIGEAV